MNASCWPISHRKLARVCAAAALIYASISPPLAQAQFVQQAKLIGIPTVGSAREGSSVALSADGNTVIAGGHSDNGDTGAAWVFTRSNGVWTEQAKLVGAGAIGAASQGTSVALSADGNTAIVGGPCDNSAAVVGVFPCAFGISHSIVGAAWVFTRSGSAWTQQSKLAGTGAIGPGAFQGTSVALSADGNTAIVGGPFDNNGIGAVWVFTRSNGVWNQQGNKLVGGGAIGAASQGSSVALTGNGNTAIVGGPNDNFSCGRFGCSSIGAAWVFTRSNGVWTQQGNKLVGAGAIGLASQGTSVALSADGNTALVGGPLDNNGIGAVWVFVRSPASF